MIGGGHEMTLAIAQTATATENSSLFYVIATLILVPGATAVWFYFRQQHQKYTEVIEKAHAEAMTKLEAAFSRELSTAKEVHDREITTIKGFHTEQTAYFRAQIDELKRDLADYNTLLAQAATTIGTNTETLASAVEAIEMQTKITQKLARQQDPR